MFSFNNPAGACSSCDGLGVTQFFDEDLVVADPDLTLAEGAIRGWDRRNIYYFAYAQFIGRSLSTLMLKCRSKNSARNIET